MWFIELLSGNGSRTLFQRMGKGRSHRGRRSSMDLDIEARGWSLTTWRAVQGGFNACIHPPRGDVPEDVYLAPLAQGWGPTAEEAAQVTYEVATGERPRDEYPKVGDERTWAWAR